MVGKRPLLIATTVLGWTMVLAGTSQAQQQILAMPRAGGYSAASNAPIGAGGVGRPAVSPYLNMTELPMFGIGNYQTLVQPFVYQRQAINSNQASIQRLQQQVTTSQSTNNSNRRPGQIIRDTGHQTRNMNYSHYFSTATVQ